MQSLIKVCPTECSLSGLVTVKSFAVNLDPLIWKISKTEMELHNGWCIRQGTKQIESLYSALSSLCCITATRSPASTSLTLNRCTSLENINTKINIFETEFRANIFGFCQMIIPPFSSLIPLLYRNAFLCFCYPQRLVLAESYEDFFI